MNPDCYDLYLEEVKDGKYLSSDGNWKEVQSYTEVIKVRFGSDINLEIKFTDNGVLLPKNFLQGGAKDFAPFLIPEIWE